MQIIQFKKINNLYCLVLNLYVSTNNSKLCSIPTDDALGNYNFGIVGTLF